MSALVEGREQAMGSGEGGLNPGCLDPHLAMLGRNKEDIAQRAWSLAMWRVRSPERVLNLRVFTKQLRNQKRTWARSPMRVTKIVGS